MNDKISAIKQFLQTLEGFDSETMMLIVEKHLNDDCIEVFVEHIENFYGINDDEELGMLAQLMVTGYLVAKNEQNYLVKNTTEEKTLN